MAHERRGTALTAHLTRPFGPLHVVERERFGAGGLVGDDLTPTLPPAEREIFGRSLCTELEFVLGTGRGRNGSRPYSDRAVVLGVGLLFGTRRCYGRGARAPFRVVLEVAACF